jgi:hypothetical protein
MTGQVATIVPLNHLDLIKNDTYFMALAHAAEDKSYLNFFRDRAAEGKYVILDNSAVELGRSEEFEAYVHKARSMNASCILLPDIFQDRAATFAEAVKGCDIIFTGSYAPDIMVVPQGTTIGEWLASAIDLYYLVKNKLDTTPIMGISCRYTEMFHGNRASAVMLLIAAAIPNLRIHLLWCYANPIFEVLPLLFHGSFGVMGVDSSYPSVYAWHGMQLDNKDFENPRPERKIDFLTDTYDVPLLKYNIRTWVKACLSSY